MAAAEKNARFACLCSLINFGACVSLYMCFYLLTTYLKGLVCVVGRFFAVQKSPYRPLIEPGTCPLRNPAETRVQTILSPRQSVSLGPMGASVVDASCPGTGAIMHRRRPRSSRARASGRRTREQVQVHLSGQGVVPTTGAVVRV